MRRRIIECTAASALGLGAGWYLRGEPVQSGGAFDRPECLHQPAQTARSHSMSTKPAQRAANIARASVDPDEDALQREEEDYRSQTRQLLGTLELQLTIFEQHEPNVSPEAIVNGSAEYIRGVADMMTTAAPQLISSFAEHIEARICAGKTAPSKAAQMMYMRLLRSVAELSSAKTFDCFFDKHKTEDVVLWEAIDALGAAELPRPKGLSELVARASAPQTEQRLLTQEEFEEYKAKQSGQALSHAAQPVVPSRDQAP